MCIPAVTPNVFTGTVTVEYSYYPYSGYSELPINDNVYRSFSTNYDYIYLYITKDNSNMATLKVAEKQ